MTLIHDQKERDAALNPALSFIVQAPAGSGKTELLTQRFLKLLALVDEPEEVLAITFTKKAASEMRSRIRDALAKGATEAEPQTAHHQKTWHLARAVLTQDQKRGWNLLQNPNRLRIKTIDAFNTLLTKQLPLLSHFGAQPEISTYPRLLYREAVQSFLSHLEENVEWSNAIAQLLLHLDNNIPRVENLLIDMLSKRDQWLPHIIAHQNHPTLRKVLEDNLQNVIRETLKKLKSSFPEGCETELLELLRFSTEQLTESESLSPILACQNLLQLPGSELQDQAPWIGIAELLLTQEGEWRKQITVKIGFPADKKFESMKKRLKDFIEHCSHHEKFQAALLELEYLPTAAYTDKQWDILKALHDVLKILVAQLHVTFKQTGKIDYIENAQAALLALGQEDAPTDLAMVLDHHIKHILVDEFQDTSYNQYRLLEKLVHHWQKGDGRTLFLVGDPMQSIYRFREAEVGLFIRAREEGIGPITLTPLTLSVNFRSQASIVEWINHHFKTVMPAFDDIASGAVSYSPSFSPLDDEETYRVGLYATQDQPAQIVQLIKDCTYESIAVLVRSRNHLLNIIPALKKANIAYQAIEIDPLESRPLIQDLLALTRALLYPADRIAWLSVLRSPLCGLTLSDLLPLSENPHTFIWQQLNKSEVFKNLSATGQMQLQRVIPLLESALQERFREEVSHWVRNTWMALGGPATAESESDLADAEIYFELLANLSQQGNLLKWDALQESLQKLFAQNHSPARVQIMTIHNAKGLEFDTVILPHLEKGTKNQDKPLLTWLERPQTHQESALLLAPIQAIEDSEDNIYRHIRHQDMCKTRHEHGRLLYVAATRAKKNLHLLMTLKTNSKGQIGMPPENSMFKKLWPTIQNEIQMVKPNPIAADTSSIFMSTIKRLKPDWHNPLSLSLNTIRPLHNRASAFHLQQSDASGVGTTVHFLLQRMALQGKAWWLNTSIEKRRDYIKRLLTKNGIFIESLDSHLVKVEKAIQNTLQDPRGLWILEQTLEAASEWSLTAHLDNETKTIIIDRTFVDENNIRWIIDYKTSHPETTDVEIFLKQEQEKYAEQMVFYKKALEQIEHREIRLGLYFPMIPEWRVLVL